MAYNNTYVALDKITVGTATPSVTFTNINQGYTDLIVVVNGGTTANGQFRIQVGNGSVDTGANYGGTQIYGYGSTVGSGREVNATNPYLCSTSSTNSSHIVRFMSYSNTSICKTWVAKGGDIGSGVYDISVYCWRSTSAINTIKVAGDGSNTISSGTTFSLYGTLASGSNPAAKATGGSIYYGADGYTYHAFTSTGTFTPSIALSCEIMAVGGGGGGSQGGGGGGGGGAGALNLFTAQSLTATGYTVTIGGGGTAGTSGTATNGIASSFASLVTAAGGGRGAGYTGGPITAGTGGSGGGGGNDSQAAGGASGSNTNIGGTGYGYPPGTGGGGGGATAAGQNANSSKGGNGGEGYPLADINTVIQTIFYPMTVIASGGGGGCQLGGTSAVAGTGGTGAGNGAKDFQSATAATSYGSGGGGSSAQSSTPSAGYQGLVVVRYASV